MRQTLINCITRGGLDNTFYEKLWNEVFHGKIDPNIYSMFIQHFMSRHGAMMIDEMKCHFGITTLEEIQTNKVLLCF